MKQAAMIIITPNRIPSTRKVNMTPPEPIRDCIIGGKIMLPARRQPWICCNQSPLVGKNRTVLPMVMP